MLHMLDTDIASYLIKGKSPEIEGRPSGDACAIDGLYFGHDAGRTTLWSPPRVIVQGGYLRYPQCLPYSSRAAKIAAWINRLIQWRQRLLGFAITATSFHRSVTSTKAP
jgi:hypothetical protein